MRVRAGVSIVEILIGAAVIGVLIMMMVNHSREGTGAGSANAIINNLRILRTAALVFVESSPDIEPTIGEVVKLSGGGVYAGYNVVIDGGVCYITFGKGGEKNSVVIDDRVKEKLTARASSIGLLGSEDNLTAPKGKYAANEAVCLIVR